MVLFGNQVLFLNIIDFFAYEFTVQQLSHHKEKYREEILLCIFGPSVEIRTRGLLNPIQARYQTSPHPDIACRLATATVY